MRIETFLRQSPVFQSNRIARRMDAALGTLLRHEDVTVFEALVLAAIFFERRGEVQPSVLAEAFETTRGNISHCISSLEAKGLVQRKLSQKDARTVQLVLQPQGRKKAVRVAAILDRVQQKIEDGVGANKLQTMLNQMNETEELCSRLAGGK